MHARVRNARCIPGRFSYRTRRRRNRFSHANVRSTAQRNRPSPLPCFVLRIASRGKTWRLCKARRMRLPLFQLGDLPRWISRRRSIQNNGYVIRDRERSGAIAAPLKHRPSLRKRQHPNECAPIGERVAFLLRDIFRCDPDLVGPNRHRCRIIPPSSRRAAARGITGEPIVRIAARGRQPDVCRNSATQRDRNVRCAGEVIRMGLAKVTLVCWFGLSLLPDPAR